MKRKATLTLLIIVITSLTLSACNHRRYRSAEHNESRAIEYLTEKLELSPAQRIELARIKAETNSLEDAEAFPRQQAARIEELGKRFSTGISKLKTVLTAEQQKTLVAELEKHGQRRHP